MEKPFYFENTMRCGCKATMRQDFDGRDIRIVQLTPVHVALVDRYRATPPWKRDGVVNPCEGG